MFRCILAQEKLPLTHYTVLQEVSSHYYMVISCYTKKSSFNNRTLNPNLEFYTFGLASVPFSLIHPFGMCVPYLSVLGFYTIYNIFQVKRSGIAFINT